MKKGSHFAKEQLDKIKRTRQTPESRKRVSDGTKLAMARPEVRAKVEPTQFKKGFKPVFTKERNKKLSEKLIPFLGERYKGQRGEVY
jgi:hypothetical protein